MMLPKPTCKSMDKQIYDKFFFCGCRGGPGKQPDKY